MDVRLCTRVTIHEITRTNAKMHTKDCLHEVLTIQSTYLSIFPVRFAFGWIQGSLASSMRLLPQLMRNAGRGQRQTEVCRTLVPGGLHRMKSIPSYPIWLSIFMLLGPFLMVGGSSSLAEAWCGRVEIVGAAGYPRAVLPSNVCTSRRRR